MTILMAGSMFFHMQLGLQVVIEDYVHLPVLEFVLLLLIRLGCLVAFLISAIAALILVLGT
jgi:succinate dehydrogenase / fumarate reductase membrane anchor subunit